MCRSECYGYGVTLCMLSVAEQHRPELNRHAQASAPGKWKQLRPNADVFLPSPRLTHEARNWEQRAEGSVRREYREAFLVLSRTSCPRVPWMVAGTRGFVEEDARCQK